MNWHQWKLFVEHSSVVSTDALHVILGVVIQVAAAALVRKSLGSVAPWCVVFALEVINEINDVWVEVWPDPGMQLGEAAKDIGLTMLLPTILLLVAKFVPRVLVNLASSPLTGSKTEQPTM